MWTSLIQVFISLLVIAGKILPVRKTQETGSCSQSNHGEMILVKDRENRDIVIVCTEINQVYSWRKTDNSKPLGEYFDPAYDCLAILKQNSNSKDGFYWITLNGNIAKRVYCDMTTDGGGYLLIGYMNDTVTWNVPSNNETVEPFGDPHWSSEFGDFPVLDFRIQVSSNDDFKNTKAHWAFRFKNKRLLKNLMIVNQGGCPYNFPGVGDILHVRDLTTDEIIAKHFACSIFGAYSHPEAKIGWTMMNSCLDKSCRSGFAYHSLVPVQVAYSGGFSFVAGETNKASTAFFGCDKGKCCACYGPRGGRDVYCHKRCQATNGGTVTKKASAWFWVRLNPPRKVLEKCQEYRIEDENGDSVWYKLVGDKVIPVKGRCGKEVIDLDNNDTIKIIRNVDGLLAYRSQDESLLLRRNNTWKALAEKDEVLQMNEQLQRVSTFVINRFLNDSSKILSCKSLVELSPQIPSGFYSFPAHKRSDSMRKKNKMYCDMPSGWSLIMQFSNKANHSLNRNTISGASNLNPTINQAKTSIGIYLIEGHEIKITRSDDPTHTALLETTNNCLGPQKISLIGSMYSFREKFNELSTSHLQCLTRCEVKYGGLYKSTAGFEMHDCNGASQSSNQIGLMCRWNITKRETLMVIGGGGKDCDNAYYGISPFFRNKGFGQFGKHIETSYALNLWIR